ncbi:predicted protein [Histoplasma capsulatum var. duboisii H88]|uniref:Predicted protein n=2 Tax=Ajellomyces capsulatus TaxID=5037 RepID=F0UP36_AJEC8|nr:predicted protein [Histoplasma capsulatum H143]EGC46895.1 predicted protein [Histoplasma capsulatum var. duboisii H88]QSS53070.1 hypothetical protein I7I53_00212 [Histoplasma capsulatum var. duboisii H88]
MKALLAPGKAHYVSTVVQNIVTVPVLAVFYPQPRDSLNLKRVERFQEVDKRVEAAIGFDERCPGLSRATLAHQFDVPYHRRCSRQMGKKIAFDEMLDNFRSFTIHQL